MSDGESTIIGNQSKVSIGLLAGILGTCVAVLATFLNMKHHTEVVETKLTQVVEGLKDVKEAVVKNRDGVNVAHSRDALQDQLMGIIQGRLLKVEEKNTEQDSAIRELQRK